MLLSTRINHKNRRDMRQRVIILIALVLGLGSLANAQKNFIDQPFIEVKGHGEMEIIPNEIYLNIFINEQNTKSKETVDVVERQMVKALKKAGIDVKKQLSVADFSGTLRHKFLRKRDVEQTKNFQLLVHDVKTLNKVFYELDKVNITNINITKVDHSDMENYRIKVRAIAAKNGKQKAEAIGKAIDQPIGKSIFIDDQSSYNTYYRANAMIMRGVSSLKSSKDEAAQLDFKKIKLTCDLQMRFAF